MFGKKIISVTILCKNNAKTLPRALDSLQGFDEVLLYDNGSTDNSKQIASQYSNVRWLEGFFDGFGPTHNRASSLAKHDWILSIDSDEWLTPQLQEEIDALDLSSEECIWRLRRKNFYRGKWIRGCGWWPDWQKRLYNKKKSSFDDALVHETIICKDMKVRELKSLLCHEPYVDLRDFLRKMQHYSDLFAQKAQGVRSSSPLKAVGHALFAFIRAYFIKGGWKLGYEGWYISVYNAHCALYKYLKLYEANIEIKKAFKKSD